MHAQPQFGKCVPEKSGIDMFGSQITFMRLYLKGLCWVEVLDVKVGGGNVRVWGL